MDLVEKARKHWFADRWNCDSPNRIETQRVNPLIHFNKWQFIKPFLVSPMIFGVVYATIPETTSALLLSTLLSLPPKRVFFILIFFQFKL
jgi:hypothetical protein